MKSCFLFGNRDCPFSIIPKIQNSIEHLHVHHNINLFYVGSRGSFDQYAATAARRAKARYPEIQLFLVLAYHPAERPFTLPQGFDGSYYPPLENVPRQFAIVRANRYMLSTVDAAICCAHHVGNSRNLLAYALQREKKGELILKNLQP